MNVRWGYGFWLWLLFLKESHESHFFGKYETFVLHGGLCSGLGEYSFSLSSCGRDGEGQCRTQHAGHQAEDKKGPAGPCAAGAKAGAPADALALRRRCALWPPPLHGHAYACPCAGPTNAPPLPTPSSQVEDPKRALILYGNRTSQTVKDVLTDLHKLKGVRFWGGGGGGGGAGARALRQGGAGSRGAQCLVTITQGGWPLLGGRPAPVTLTRPRLPCCRLSPPPAPQTDSLRFTSRNEAGQPCEAGGEAPLEGHASRANCSLYALGGHSKKRPHNLTLGRLYDFRCYDMVEFGIAGYRSIQSFGGAANTQLGNKVGVGGRGGVGAELGSGGAGVARGRQRGAPLSSRSRAGAAPAA